MRIHEGWGDQPPVDGDLIARLQDKKDLPAEDEKALKDAIADWKKNGSY